MSSPLDAQITKKRKAVKEAMKGKSNGLSVDTVNKGN